MTDNGATDNRTTELLRKLLEERGLGCQTHHLHAFWCVGPKLYEAVDNLDGTLTVGNLTPEQAVAATLGSTLTAEQVCEAIERHVKFYEGGDYDEQAIADELNGLGSGTCEDVGSAATFKCSECGWYSPVFTFGEGMPRFCPQCGKAVKR